ncbi:ImmA/IrrE family metallo-endopeptidase [Paludicola sp. MB14-C6]|uniref:ImmA/IrrE family metallo-endopeptidase n=1 Tax=Paludihabitans sp. MB14-C6 TaxID=3070656 RepID=UPI0027DB0644|nr:ImmA/IrrE family metallo-endopeptidase [Paludicola sp. MB14-C6]WMJ23715.1 ImmA/IrrE family metallo-endopeptidase [Paludicola sp. MB14-C6]
MSQYITDIVDQLIKQYKTRDPFELTEALNIFVGYRPFNSLKGFYCVMNRERHIILNDNLSEQEQRLVIAHELGHDRLHQTFAKVSPMKDFQLYDMTSKPEYQANYFAAELLIDDNDVISLAEEGMDYNNIAQLLEVPNDLLSFKLHSLNQKGHKFNIPKNISSRFLGK